MPQPVTIAVAILGPQSWEATIPGVAGAFGAPTASAAVAALKRAYTTAEGDEADGRHHISRQAELAGWRIVHPPRRAHVVSPAVVDPGAGRHRTDGLTMVSAERRRR